MVEVIAPSQNEQVQVLYHLLYASEMDDALLRQHATFASEAFRCILAGVEVCNLFAMPLLMVTQPNSYRVMKVSIRRSSGKR